MKNEIGKEGAIMKKGLTIGLPVFLALAFLHFLEKWQQPQKCRG